MYVDLTGDEEGLVGYWNFNEGEGNTVYDLSGNGNHGTINGATWSDDVPEEPIYGCTDPLATNYNPGANVDDGSCEYPDNGDYLLSFNGFDDYVDCNGDELFNFGTGDFTLEHWYKSDLTSGHFPNSISKYGGTNYYYDITINRDDTGFPQFHFANGNGQDYYAIGNMRVDDNQWHYLSAVREGNLIKLYIDGLLSGTGNIPQGANADNSGNILFGARGASNHENYMDDVKIYNRALSIQEIQTNLDADLNSIEEGLVGYWKFNSGEGYILYDHSGNGNHGTIHGATWVENIPGCTDEYAYNFNPDATVEDGSCEYAITLELDSVIVNTGEQFSIDVTVAFPDSLYNSFEMTIGGYLEELTFNNILTTNTMLESSYWTNIQYNENEEGLHIAASGTDAITGTGTLFTLQFTVPNETEGIIPITFENALFNESSINIIFVDGQVDVINTPPVADFSVNIEEGFVPLTVSFTNSSSTGTGINESYLWDFGDGNTSIETSPEYVYNDAGIYSVSLTITTTHGEDTEVKENYITVNQTYAPTPQFSAEPEEGYIPLTVQFSNLTELGTGENITYLWDFGDESTSQEDNPSHIYNEVGEFNVSLTASSTHGDSTLVIEGAVTVNPTIPPIVGFSAEPQISLPTFEIIFTDTSNIGSGEVTSYFWDYGDGNTSSIENSAHSYDEPGQYDISLTLTTTHGTNTLTKEGYVTIGLPGDVSLNNEVHAYDSYLILDYLLDPEVNTLSPVQLVNSDISLDNTISALDASLILQYVVGLIEELPVSDVENTFAATGDIVLEGTSMSAGEEVTVPLIISNGNNIWAFDGLIEYDESILTYSEIIWNPSIDDYSISINNESGRLHFVGAGTNPDGETGQFAYIVFNVTEELTTDETIVTLSKLRWNEEEILENVSEVTITTSLDNEEMYPTEYSLREAYPNPFNPTTTISFALPQESAVSITVYNMQGSEVATLTNGNYIVGNHQIIWDASSHASGTYFLKMVAGNFVDTQKIVLVK